MFRIESNWTVLTSDRREILTSQLHIKEASRGNRRGTGLARVLTFQGKANINSEHERQWRKKPRGVRGKFWISLRSLGITAFLALWDEFWKKTILYFIVNIAAIIPLLASGFQLFTRTVLGVIDIGRRGGGGTEDVRSHVYTSFPTEGFRSKRPSSPCIFQVVASLSIRSFRTYTSHCYQHPSYVFSYIRIKIFATSGLYRLRSFQLLHGWEILHVECQTRLKNCYHS